MNLAATTISTARLTIIPVNKQYADDIFRELTPKVATYLSFDPTGKIEDIYTFITKSQVNMRRGEEMPVVIINTVTNEFIGCAGVHKIRTGKPELGIWIKQSAYRQGYGKEVIQGLISWARNNLEFKFLTFPVAKANTPSRKLIESLGGIIVEEKTTTSPSGKVLDEVIYRVNNF